MGAFTKSEVREMVPKYSDDWVDLGHGIAVCSERGETLVRDDDLVYSEYYINDLGYGSPADFIKHLLDREEAELKFLADHPFESFTVEELPTNIRELDNRESDWDEINMEEEQ